MRNLAVTASSNSISPIRPQIITHSSKSLPKEMTMFVAKGGHKRFSKVTVLTYIKVPLEVCFDLVTKQLEETPEWDPTIRWVVPICHEYIRVGNKSRVTFDLAGSIEEAIVVLRSFVPNKVIMWTSNHSNQLQEQWQFGREPNSSTLVTVSLSYNPYRGWFKYFNRWARMNGQIERVVSEMLRRLKITAELPKPNYF